jgi:hypothetical protein
LSGQQAIEVIFSFTVATSADEPDVPRGTFSGPTHFLNLQNRTPYYKDPAGDVFEDKSTRAVQDALLWNYSDSDVIPSQFGESFIAGEILGGQRVVAILSGLVYYFDPSNDSFIGRQLGMTDHAADATALVRVVMGGVMVNSGWGITQNAIYYAGALGTITSTIPTPPGVFQRIGIAVDSDTMKLEFSEPISTI